MHEPPSALRMTLPTISTVAAVEWLVSFDTTLRNPSLPLPLQGARLWDHDAWMIGPAMKATDPGTGFSCEGMVVMPGSSLSADHTLTAGVNQFTGSNSTRKVSYGTEGGFHQEAGIPTLIPGHGAQALQQDESVAQGELDSPDAFIRRLVDRLLV